MKTIFLLSAIVFFAFAGFVQETVRGQEIQGDTLRNEPVRVDTVWVEKVRVDTVWVEKAKVEPQQPPVQQPAPKDQKSKKKNEKVYYGGYANLSFGQYTLFGFEPLIGYRLLPKFSVGAKLKYEYVKDKRYETDYEASNYGFSLFARRRFLKKIYAHIEYSKMNYKLYDPLGASEHNWVSFFFLGGGISQPISKRTSVNAQVLWDLNQDEDSPYKTVQPFFSVGIGVGF